MRCLTHTCPSAHHSPDMSPPSNVVGEIMYCTAVVCHASALKVKRSCCRWAQAAIAIPSSWRRGVAKLLCIGVGSGVVPACLSRETIGVLTDNAVNVLSKTHCPASPVRCHQMGIDCRLKDQIAKKGVRHNMCLHRSIVYDTSSGPLRRSEWAGGDRATPNHTRIVTRTTTAMLAYLSQMVMCPMPCRFTPHVVTF